MPKTLFCLAATAALAGCSRSENAQPVATIDIPTQLQPTADVVFDDSKYEGVWLRNNEIELFAAVEPKLRVHVLRPVGGRSLLQYAEHPFGGLRTCVMDPVQTKNWDLPSRQPAEIVEQRDDYLFLRASVDPQSGYQAELELTLDGPSVHVIHRIINRSGSPKTMAAWTIASIPNGHNGVIEANVRQDFAENDGFIRSIGFFPNTPADHPAFELDGDMVRVYHDVPREKGWKIGAVVPSGVATYRDDELELRSQVSYEPGELYPEGGWNVTMYKNWNLDEPQWHYTELEHVGPLREVQPGEAAELRQTLTLRSLD
jgi:hypothetical protein